MRLKNGFKQMSRLLTLSIGSVGLWITANHQILIQVIIGVVTVIVLIRDSNYYQKKCEKCKYKKTFYS